MDRQQVTTEPTNFWEDPQVVDKPIEVYALLARYLGRWPFLLLLSLAGGALAFGLTFLLTPRYTSRAVFLAPSPQASSSDSAISLLFKTPPTAIYSGMLMSNSVVTDVVNHTNLEQAFKTEDMDAARASLRQIATTSTDTAGFVTLSVTYKDPKLARDIVQNFLSALATLNDRLAVTEAAQQREIFQSQLEKAKNDLEASEVALKMAQEASGVVSPESQIRSGLSAIDLARADIRARQVSLTALLQSETEQSPDVQRLRSEIGAEEAQLSALEGASSNGRGTALSAAEAPSISLKFVQLDREVKYNEVLFDVMAKQFENAKLRESSAAPSVQVVDYPEVPLHKSWPSRRLFAVGGAAAGLLLAGLIVTLRERQRRRREDPTRQDSLASLAKVMRAPSLMP
jgi:tyrosine-protein kinase Etk/Wzc